MVLTVLPNDITRRESHIYTTECLKVLKTNMYIFSCNIVYFDMRKTFFCTYGTCEFSDIMEVVEYIDIYEEFIQTTYIYAMIYYCLQIYISLK